MPAIQQVMMAAVAGFSPLNIASLDWWLTADSLALNDGDAVVDWLDSSTAAKNYGQNTSTNQPTYKTNIVNGRPIVRFATDDKLVPDPNPRTLGTTNTLIICCTPTTSTNDYILGGSQSGGGPAIITGFSSKAFEYFSGNGAERATFATSTSGFHILSLTRTDSSGNYVGYFDGAQVFSTAVNAGANWNGHQWDEVGANGAAGGDDFFNGDIAQILHFNAILTTTQLNNVHSYLGSEYNISVTLN